MRIFVALALCLGFQFSAFAKTEHFYTADKGQFFVEGSANYLNSGETSTDPSSGGTSLAEYTLEDLKFTAHAEYGFLDFLSVYANLAAGYGENVEDGQDTVEARFKALDNLNLGAKSTYQFGPGAALAALNVGLGIGKKSKKKQNFWQCGLRFKTGL